METQISDEEYRTQLKELVAKAKGMYHDGKYKNKDYGEICMATVRLVESSEFGIKDAESELELMVTRDPYEEVMSGDFDGVSMQFMEMCSQLLRRFGEVSMAPYSKGIGTRTAKAYFKHKSQGGN